MQKNEAADRLLSFICSSLALLSVRRQTGYNSVAYTHILPRNDQEEDAAAYLW